MVFRAIARHKMLRSHSIRTIQELSGKQEDRMEPQSLLEVIEILVDFRNICARAALLCKAARARFKQYAPLAREGFAHKRDAGTRQ